MCSNIFDVLATLYLFFPLLAQGPFFSPARGGEFIPETSSAGAVLYSTLPCSFSPWIFISLQLLLLYVIIFFFLPSDAFSNAEKGMSFPFKEKMAAAYCKQPEMLHTQSLPSLCWKFAVLLQQKIQISGIDIR